MNNFPDDEIAISAQGLRCAYGSFEAVHGIDLTIRNGEFFALLGTNGAGKTTTMETLEGHRPASGGSVSVLGGNPFTQKASIRPRLGIMLQEAGFADDLTVRETVEMWLKQSSSARGAAATRKAAATDALEALEALIKRQRGSNNFQAASAEGSIWRWRRRTSPKCSSSMNQPPALIQNPGNAPGT
nr:ATP-binding cassette domain-containing protein [Renibacterium salmoninarum]